MRQALIALLALCLVGARAEAAPSRVASLGLCTDELVLLLARPGQLVSVSFLAHDPLETALAGKAKGLHSNDGRLSSVIGLKPDLVVTGGAVNRFARELAARTGTPVIDIPPPGDIAGLRANIRRVARALGNPRRGEALVAWMDSRLGSPPAQAQRTLMVVAGGLTPAPDSLATELLSYAGAAQAPIGAGRITLERLLREPTTQVVVSDYRGQQYSMPQAWLKSASTLRKHNVMHVDGRLWTCPGPLAAADVERLRRELSQ